MQNTTTTKKISKREIFYFRQRLKNRIFQSIHAYFAKKAESEGLTKKELSERIDKDPAQITKWLSGVKNLELNTISDLLLGMGVELSHEIIPINDGHKQSYIKLIVNNEDFDEGIKPPIASATETPILKYVEA